MAEQVIHIPVETLKRFMKDVFVKLGVPAEEAEICRDILIASDLRGIDSHGVGRLKMYYDRIKAGIQFTTTNFDIVKETETTATVDGHHGMGHVIGYKAMRMAMDKAKQYGLGAVAVRNSTHYGIAGYYVLMAAKEDMMGLTVTNARPSIAPTFGVEPMLGTNPITFGAPSDMAFPFVIDCATSISQRGKIEYLDRAEQPTPEGWAIDQQGNPHTDTKQLLQDLVSRTAALLPIGGAGEIRGGHKGYGYATLVEILSASLQGGSYLKDLLGFDEQGNRVPYKLGHFFLAIDVAHFIDVDTCKRVTGEIMRGLQNSKKAPGQERIYVAGEKEYEWEQRRIKEGIPANENLQQNLRTMQEELGLTGYDFLP
ncbi:Ldh family oxidoreductase [candidate division KSB3 bacterium]|uniref:Ldh family oxidoreductase n=1 Tax=candidate division KSB3 bacterium TaxID=2044937 RepID=A0A9D5K0G7_9BACT|nr:Ldh family oxidoreductase [candidate division KSB3 bacterium]MBD3327351.1 Ldh family oxidoreductase [candidate division KSB3 bacterium]